MAASDPPSAYDRVFNDVRKDLPSVPDAVLRQTMFRVMDDFTQHTNIWQDSAPIEVVPGIVSYPFEVSPGKPNRLLFVYDQNVATQQWPMTGLLMRVPGVLTLSRLPSDSKTWIVVVAKRVAEVDPSTNYPMIDEWIVDKYADTLGMGILGRLQIMPQKPWSNPMLAQPNLRAYYSGRSEARVNDSHANVYNGQRWSYPQSWATITRKPWS